MKTNDGVYLCILLSGGSFITCCLAFVTKDPTDLKTRLLSR